MAESLEDGLSIIEQGKRVYINKRLSDITGFPQKALMDMTWEDLACSEEKERIKAAHIGIADGRDIPVRIEFWVNCKNKQRRCIQNRYSSKEWEKGVVDSGRKTSTA